MQFRTTDGLNTFITEYGQGILSEIKKEFLEPNRWEITSSDPEGKGNGRRFVVVWHCSSTVTQFLSSLIPGWQKHMNHIGPEGTIVGGCVENNIAGEHNYSLSHRIFHVSHKNIRYLSKYTFNSMSLRFRQHTTNFNLSHNFLSQAVDFPFNVLNYNKTLQHLDGERFICQYFIVTLSIPLWPDMWMYPWFDVPSQDWAERHGSSPHYGGGPLWLRLKTNIIAREGQLIHFWNQSEPQWLNDDYRIYHHR